MDADRRKVHGEAAIELHASFGSLDELRYVCMAWIEARVCVDDTNDWPGQSVFTVTYCLGLKEHLISPKLPDNLTSEQTHWLAVSTNTPQTDMLQRAYRALMKTLRRNSEK